MKIRLPEYDKFPNSTLADAAPNTWHRFYLQYASGIGGKPFNFPVAVMLGSRPGPRVCVVAGVHGDEFEGIKALWDLILNSSFSIDAGKLIIVPVVNLPAYESGNRISPIDAVNLARVFPGRPDGTISERLAHTLFSQVVLPSDFLIDLHSGGIRYLHLPLSGFYDVDGDIGQKSLQAARSLGWRFLWSAPRRDGVLSYEAVKHGVPAIGTEVGGAGRCLSGDVAFYPDAFESLFFHLGLSNSQPNSNRFPEQVIINGDWLIAEASGFIENQVELGDEVVQGEVLARILNPFGDSLQEITASRSGTVVGLRSFPTILAGEWSVFVGKAEAAKKE